jgi:hypothetical protein
MVLCNFVCIIYHCLILPVLKGDILNGINLDNIHKIKDRIISDINEENAEMESEVLVLQTALDKEVDATSRQNTPQTKSPAGKSILSDTFDDLNISTAKPLSCLKCGNSLGTKDPGRIRARKGLPNLKTEECQCMKLKPARDTSKQSSDNVEGVTNTNTPGGESVRGGSSKSKFRSRLQAAQDEKHFMDDVI